MQRTVAILASAVESPITTVSARAMRFFLNIEEKMAEDTRLQQEGEWFEKHGAVDCHLHSRKTKRRQRQTQRALKNRKKRNVRKNFMLTKAIGWMGMLWMWNLLKSSTLPSSCFEILRASLNLSLRNSKQVVNEVRNQTAHDKFCNASNRQPRIAGSAYCTPFCKSTWVDIIVMSPQSWPTRSRLVTNKYHPTKFIDAMTTGLRQDPGAGVLSSKPGI